MFNPGEPTFLEDRLVEELIDYEKYQELIDEDLDDEAMDYWEEAKENITEEKYKDFIDEIMNGNRYLNYEIINH